MTLFSTHMYVICSIEVSLLCSIYFNTVSCTLETHQPDYTKYHNLSKLYATVFSIIERNPAYFHLDHSYTSREGSSQLLLRVTNFSDSRDARETAFSYWTLPKVRILLSYGEHARELFPVESMLFLLRNITRGLAATRDSPQETYSRFILNKVDLYVVALVNPDGRRLIEKTHDYCWRGTSTGVDINRNFGWNFGGQGSSVNPGHEELRGSHPFSEPECHVLVDLTTKFQFDAFISFHSGIREIYLPFADSLSKKLNRKPQNFDGMLELAKRVADVTKFQFKFGQAFELMNYPADGTVFDYMAGVRKIPFSYAIELWGEGDIPGNNCFDTFNPPAELLEEMLKAAHPIYEEIFLYLIHWKERQLQSFFTLEHDIPPLTLCIGMLAVVILFTMYVACQHRLPERWRLHRRRRLVSLKSLSSTFHVS